MKLKIQGFLLVLFYLISYTQLTAQGLYKVSIDDKVKQSPLIVEGKVLSQESFWNDAHTMIFTSSKVQVYKVFKGKLHESVIEILTQGGTVDGTSVTASELLQLNPDETGVFFCYPENNTFTKRTAGKIFFDIYGSKQGFLKYNLHEQTASAPFAQYKGIEETLYRELQSRTKQAAVIINKQFSVKKFAASVNKIMNGHSIVSFSPSIVTAGAFLDPANNVLTINGTGFGSGAGSAAVIFDDADDGSGGNTTVIPFNHPLIVSWTDTQIQVKVPTNAGTGLLQVRDAGGTSTAAPSNLNVLYSILSRSITSSGITYFKESNLMNFNGSGGYTIRVSNNNLNSGADLTSHPIRGTFQRALTTWQQVAGVNFTEGATTSVQSVSNDGINTVTLDNTNSGVPPLPSGVLAVCYSFDQICSDNIAGNQVQKTGFDIIIRNAGISAGTATFTVGPCPPSSSNYSETDLETVILHELGHALNLGHINDGNDNNVLPYINPAKIMNYSISNAVRRNSLDYAAKMGATYAAAIQGNTYGNCLAPGEMTLLTKITEALDECPATFPTESTPDGTVVVFDLAHATSNKFGDPQSNAIRCDGNRTSVTNNAYYALKTGTTDVLSFSVSGYSTTPSGTTTCPTPYGIPTSGVKMALYNVGNCPGGQAFPTPVACRTFNGNGIVTDITGLMPNTNYLLYVDGIENFKSSFSLAIGNFIALPLRLTSFKGVAKDGYNQLFWTSDQVVNVKKMIIQRSTNGESYMDIGEIELPALFEKGSFTDPAPLPGNNLYRLQIVDNDGKKQYSAIVSLVQTGKFSWYIYPNPVKDRLHVVYNPERNKTYQLKLINNLAQIVFAKTLNSSGKEEISLQDLPKGIYQVIITDHTQQVIVSKKLFVQ